MTEPAGSSQIEPALRRARAFWLNSATVNAGGRWAVVPAVGIAVVGACLMIADVRDPVTLACVASIGLLAVFATLVLTRRTYSRPGRAGAPDWSLGLDRALGLRDALPTLLESPGVFSDALNARIAAELTPQRAREAGPKKHFAPLLVAMILCLMPLAGLAPDALPKTAPDAPTAAKADKARAKETPGNAGTGDGQGEGEGGQPGGDGKAAGRKGEGGQPQPKDDGSAGDAPKDKPKPDPLAPPAKNNPQGPGDKQGPPPKPAEPPPPKDVKSQDTRITPDVGEGDTRKESRSRWLYNPDGAPLPDAQARAQKIEGNDELAIPRQKITSTERKRLAELFDTLYR